MSNLSNLHISGSYRGLINLEDSTQPLVSQSGDINLQDGLGDNVGLKINAQTKKFTIDNDLRVDGNTDLNGNLDVSGSFVHSGSIDIKGNVVVDGNINATIGTFDTINTRLLHVTEESASVIISSGSNVIGDETSDTQTIVGQTTISGSLSLLNGTNLTVINGDISSSTVSGIGNVTQYSASVDSKIQSLIANSGSQELRLNSLEAFTSSQESINSGYNTFTQSIDSRFNTYTSSNDIEQTQQNNRLDSLEAFTGSLVADFVTDTQLTAALAEYVTTASFDIDSASFDTRIGNSFDLLSYNNSSGLITMFRENGGTQSATVSNVPALSSSLDIAITNNTNRIDALSAETGSYAKLDAPNNFSGSQIITGSVNGNVETLTITSLTASIDCSLGNFFTLNLPTGSTHFTATNIVPGQTISLRLGSNSGRSVTFGSGIELPVGIGYTPSVSSSYDLLTFVSFDTESLYGVAVNLFNR